MESKQDNDAQAKMRELEGNVKISARFIDAVERSTFHGQYAMDIGMLVGFLKEQNAKSKAELQKALADMKAPQPEFKKSEPVKVAA